MAYSIFLLNIIAVVTLCTLELEGNIHYEVGNNTDMEAALLLYQNYEKRHEKMMNKLIISIWNYKTNLTDYNKREYNKMNEEIKAFHDETRKNATSFAWENLEDIDVAALNWFLYMSKKPDEKVVENAAKLKKVITEMEEIYGKAKVCSYLSTFLQPCTLELDPDISEIMKESRNYQELKHFWTQWRDETGRKMRGDYLRYIDLNNENGYSNTQFEVDEDYFLMWETLKPLYRELHAYVRRKLIGKYSESYIKPNGPIPAHLLGNLWAYSWGNIFDLVIPYPNKKSVDVTKAMREKNITPLDMFKIAEKFFTSIGLKPMPPEFWNKSIIEKPLNREMVCHPSAWYFFDGNDVRIKMCTSVDMDNLATVHHEMGHIEYYLHVQDLSLYQRHGAHPAFHEAVGDLIALSVTTTDYLERIGLLEEATDDPETEINILLYMALEKIAFQPHGLIVDLWRSNIFNGSTDKSELNKAWWKLRLDYQGVCPPVLRSEDDFDAGALYHVGADITYLRYFASIIVQFQFHQALCEEAGHKGPLHKCSIYKNKKAGKLLSDMLKLGSSVPWTEAMKLITKGKTDKMDSASILEYFQPLYAWLKKQNRNEFVGWNTSGDPMKCP
ncbi:angiotensin-converting enzyme isoform X1 [Parasteatoda tepidariorum]|uniref:angiotensin-converting enzyme isoform X1 n=1 Tax=Parasteatoda tepidariorum TaxID=114398 RepID=UPI0039BCBBC2